MLIENMKKVDKKGKWKNIDFTLLIIVFMLSGLGLILIKSATLSTGSIRLVQTQAIAILIGLVAIVFFILVDYKLLGKLYIPIYVVSNLLLVAVLIFGFGEDTWGSRSWLSIAGVSFQPAEFVKLGLIISLAKFIDNHKETINHPTTLLKILAFAFFPVLLIMKQPDAGTAMVFVFFIAIMLFVAGLDWKYIGYALGAGLLSLPIIWFKLDPYQKDRFFGFLDPEANPLGSTYQAMHGQIAIGSGKIFGRGLYKGVQVQNNYVPEAQTDFIFPLLVEELGFIGGIVLIFLFLILLLKLIKIARDSNDLFGSLMVIGIAAMFLFHIWENIGMTMGLMPITGIPLPFISHGGTFMLINMISIGIALSVNYHKDGLNF